MAIQYRSGTPYRSSTQYDGTGGVTNTAQGLTLRVRIYNPTDQSLTSKARIAIRQGWPIPDPSSGNYSFWQPTQLELKARLTNNIAISNQTLRMNGRIAYRTVPQALQVQARIGRAGFLSMCANIQPQFITNSVRASFYVQKTTQTSVRAVYYVQGASQNWTLSLKVRIVKPYTSRCTGHFIIATPVAFSSVVVIENPTVLGSTRQTFSMRARIV